LKLKKRKVFDPDYQVSREDEERKIWEDGLENLNNQHKFNEKG